MCTRCFVLGDSMPGPKRARRAEKSGSRKRGLDGARDLGRIDHRRRSSWEELGEGDERLDGPVDGAYACYLGYGNKS